MYLGATKFGGCKKFAVALPPNAPRGCGSASHYAVHWIWFGLRRRWAWMKRRGCNS